MSSDRLFRQGCAEAVAWGGSKEYIVEATSWNMLMHSEAGRINALLVAASLSACSLASAPPCGWRPTYLESDGWCSDCHWVYELLVVVAWTIYAQTDRMGAHSFWWVGRDQCVCLLRGTVEPGGELAACQDRRHAAGMGSAVVYPV